MSPLPPLNTNVQQWWMMQGCAADSEDDPFWDSVPLTPQEKVPAENKAPDQKDLQPPEDKDVVNNLRPEPKDQGIFDSFDLQDFRSHLK